MLPDSGSSGPGVDGAAFAASSGTIGVVGATVIFFGAAHSNVDGVAALTSDFVGTDLDRYLARKAHFVSPFVCVGVCFILVSSL